jgi:hypothetical protein
MNSEVLGQNQIAHLQGSWHALFKLQERPAPLRSTILEQVPEPADVLALLAPGAASFGQVRLEPSRAATNAGKLLLLCYP